MHYPNVEATRDREWAATSMDFVCKKCMALWQKLEAVMASDEGYIE